MDEGKKITDAKCISKIAKIALGLLFYASCWFNWLSNLGIGLWELAACHLTAYGIIAGTIDVNIIIDKFVKKGAEE